MESDQQFSANAQKLLDQSRGQVTAGIQQSVTKSLSGLGSTIMNISTNFETPWSTVGLEMCGKHKCVRENERIDAAERTDRLVHSYSLIIPSTPITVTS